MLQYYKENYREYIELIIAMELGFDCDYFKVSKEKQDEMFYNFLDGIESSICDMNVLEKYFRA